MEKRTRQTRGKASCLCIDTALRETGRGNIENNGSFCRHVMRNKLVLLGAEFSLYNVGRKTPWKTSNARGHVVSRGGLVVNAIKHTVFVAGGNGHD